MDGLSRAVGAAVPVRLFGRWRFLPPMTLADIGAIENYLLSIRRPAKATLARKLDGIPVSIVESIVKEADKLEKQQRNYITIGEFNQFIYTRFGCAMTTWLAMRRDDPEVTLEKVATWIEKLDEDAFAQLLYARDLASGISELAERDWMIEPDELDEPQDEQYKRFNWKYVVRKLCEAYMGMTPDDVGRMTLYTFRLMSVPEGNVKGRRIPLSEWREKQRKKKAKEGKTDE